MVLASAQLGVGPERKDRCADTSTRVHTTLHDDSTRRCTTHHDDATTDGSWELSLTLGADSFIRSQTLT